MTSRRQDENLIRPSSSRRGVTHTLSSSNKIKSSKENILSFSASGTGKTANKPKDILGKPPIVSKLASVNSKAEKQEDGKKGIKSVSRKPLASVHSSTPASTPRSVLTSKPNSIQPTQPINPTIPNLKPKIASTPSVKTRIKSTQTPSRTQAQGSHAQNKSGKTKSTLSIYTPGPSTKSKLRFKEDKDADGADDIEYMPPVDKEIPYQSHFAIPSLTQNQEDGDLVGPSSEPQVIPEDTLDDVVDDLVINPRRDNNDFSFNLDLDPIQDDLQFNINVPDDFLLDI